MIFNTAKVMSKGQITLPIDIRRNMGLKTGDRVALIYDNNTLRQGLEKMRVHGYAAIPVINSEGDYICLLYTSRCV